MKTADILNSLEQLEAALQKLACLGNGDSWGNSEGNCIAQGALLHLDGLTKRMRQESFPVAFDKSTAEIAERFFRGEKIKDIAKDYDLSNTATGLRVINFVKCRYPSLYFRFDAKRIGHYGTPLRPLLEDFRPYFETMLADMGKEK